jgi:hypothetical protein
VELDLRGRRLRAALAAVLVPGNVPELLLVHAWLDLAGGRVGIVTGEVAMSPSSLIGATGIAVTGRPPLR